MSGNEDWFQNFQVPSFTQMLKKNLPVEPSSTTMNPLPGYSASEDYNMLNLISKITEITEALLSKIVLPNQNTVRRPKKIPKKFITKYKRGEIHPVSALHQFAQKQCVQLDLKETVTTVDVMGPCFAFCAVVDGVQYKTGLGRNKKQSRFNAAKLALDELLQLDDPEPQNVETSEW